MFVFMHADPTISTLKLSYLLLFSNLRKSMYLAIFYGLMYALSDGLIYFMYTAAFRFATFLITLESDSVAVITYKEIVV